MLNFRRFKDANEAKNRFERSVIDVARDFQLPRLDGFHLEVRKFDVVDQVGSVMESKDFAGR